MDVLPNTSSFYHPENISAVELNEISRTFRIFGSIQEIKKSYDAKLKERGLNEQEFVDFNLGTMEILNNVRVDMPVNDFLRDALIGLSHVLNCLQSRSEFSSASKQFLFEISNAMSVIEHVIRKQGSRIPNLGSEEDGYRRKVLDRLPLLTAMYLRNKPDYKVLKHSQTLIMDFQVISEISESLTILQDKFERIRRREKRAEDGSIESPITIDYDSSSLLIEMEERIDLSRFI